MDAQENKTSLASLESVPRQPHHDACVDRFPDDPDSYIIGTLRRECLDHVVVLGESHLRHIVRRYLSYYHAARTHLALEKDAPESRPIQTPDQGRLMEIPEVGGLHHRYERRAA